MPRGNEPALGLRAATALVIGHTIAVGIFLTPAQLIGALASPGLVIALWAAFGLLVLCGALSVGELASRYPDAGGPYVFLREAWGPRVAFLYGWQCLLVMDPGVIAALAAGLAEYLPVVWPGAAPHARWWAIGAIWALAAANASGLGTGARLMEGLTALKLAALAVMVTLAFATGGGRWSHFEPFWERRAGAPPIGEALALGCVAAFFSFGGFWEASRVAGEVRDPRRVLPRALALGVGAVAAAYLVTSLAFVYLVPPERATSAGAFARLAGEALFGGSGGRVFAAIVVASIAASMMGLLLMAPRVYYAMSLDGLFVPRHLARLHPRRKVPARATFLLAALATLVAAAGTFAQIVSFFICTAIAFVALAVGGLFVLRRRGARYEGFAVPGYPVTPALFIALVAVVIALVMAARPLHALAGLGIVLCGLPAYRALMRRSGSGRAEAASRMGTAALACLLIGEGAPPPSQLQAPDLPLFFQSASRDDREANAALETLARGWRDGYAALIVDLARLMRPAAREPQAAEEEPLPRDDETGVAAAAPPPDPRFTERGRSTPQARVRARLTRFLERQTGRRFGDDLWAWREWMWSRPYEPHPGYFAFKGALYGQIDPRMREFFPPGGRSIVRLDEVDWGGVMVNGIPPLGHPEVLAADQARYLGADNVVFGLVVNGEARAYPKRVLAWHELARDRLGGVDMTIVYCTLCGTVIPYESHVEGVLRTFGTSGLLYRSNKLMFDRESMSLWSTLEGRPVIGALAGADLQLRAHPIVTTTWGEWRAAHPGTTVLSPETGVKRDYSEGAAYRDYFGTDRLMFRVSKTDRRLKNKAEVLVMRVAGEDGVRRPVAIAAELLRRNRLYELEMGGRRFVVLTTPKGANRVYEAGGARFTSWNGRDRLQDAAGTAWRVTEEALAPPAGVSGRALPRLAAQRAFWFAWYAQFPETALIK